MTLEIITHKLIFVIDCIKWTCHQVKEGGFLLKLLIISGVAGGLIINLFGGWDLALQTLLLFITIDYFTGLVVAGVFKKSLKSPNGALNSVIGFKGVSKKCMMLLMVLIGHHIDLITELNFVRYGVIMAFIANELISIVENAGLMGIPIPEPIRNSISILKKKGDDHENNTENNNK